LALESRAFPFFIYDPDGGPSLADRLDLQGNPALEEQWPTFELFYRDKEGAEQTMTLPVTVADWAATQTRFAGHFSRTDQSSWDKNMLPFHKYLGLSQAERNGKAPFVYTTDTHRHLDRLLVSDQMVRLAEDRLRLWSELKALAGVKHVAAGPSQDRPVASTSQAPVPRPKPLDFGVTPKRATRSAATGPPVRTAAPEQPSAPETIDLGPPRDPYIDSPLCTTCKECTNINSRMFAYDNDKRAIIKDPRAGSFKELVRAAELCPPRIIHPGTPLDPTEKDLEKWLKRAKPFK
jgi:pyruvate-ferredoxin/flavodoxin oxidoreductase